MAVDFAEARVLDPQSHIWIMCDLYRDAGVIHPADALQTGEGQGFAGAGAGCSGAGNLMITGLRQAQFLAGNLADGLRIAFQILNILLEQRVFPGVSGRARS